MNEKDLKKNEIQGLLRAILFSIFFESLQTQSQSFDSEKITFSLYLFYLFKWKNVAF